MAIPRLGQSPPHCIHGCDVLDGRGQAVRTRGGARLPPRDGRDGPHDAGHGRRPNCSTGSGSPMPAARRLGSPTSAIDPRPSPTRSGGPARPAPSTSSSSRSTSSPCSSDGNVTARPRPRGRDAPRRWAASIAGLRLPGWGSPNRSSASRATSHHSRAVLQSPGHRGWATRPRSGAVRAPSSLGRQERRSTLVSPLGRRSSQEMGAAGPRIAPRPLAPFRDTPTGTRTPVPRLRT